MASITNSVIDDLSPNAQSIDYLLQRANTFVPLQTLSAGMQIDTNRKAIPRGNRLSVENISTSIDVGGRISANATRNAYNDGSDWQRMDTAEGAVLLQTVVDGIKIWSASAGANPISWTLVAQWDTAGKQTIGTVPLTRLALNAGGAVFDTADKMTAGTVPLARMGSVVANSSQLVSAGTSSSITIDSTALGHKFFIYSLYAGSSAIHGTLVDGSEAVVATLHSVLNYGPTGTVFLTLINGFTSDQTVNYKVYKLTET